MEKISIQSTYTQVNLYARFSTKKNAAAGAAGDAAAAETGAAAASGDGKGLERGRSKDGDTFTLSLEARTLQISETYTIEDDGTGNDGGTAATAKDGAGAANATDASGKAAATDPLTGTALVNSLMDALKTIGANNGKDGTSGKHRHHFPQLSDPQDVADNLLSQIDKDYATKGGAKADIAADIKKKLADWKPSSSKVTVEYQEFRSEVHMKLSSGLDDWAQGDNAGTALNGSSPVGPASGADPATPAGTGSV